MSRGRRLGQGRLARLDDAVLGAPGTKHGWYGDLFLGLHPWLRPVWAVVVLAGLGIVVSSLLAGEWTPAIIGLGWVLAGSLYFYVSRGKAARPPRP